MLVDNLVLVILLMFTVMGYRKGVITEFISFSALLFNVVLSKEITPYIVKKLNINHGPNLLIGLKTYPKKC